MTIIPIMKTDLDQDGKKEELLLDAEIIPVVDIGDLKKPARYNVDILIKEDDKITKIGTIREVEQLRVVRILTLKTEAGIPERQIVVLEAKRGENKMYYGVIKSILFPLPHELFDIPMQKTGVLEEEHEQS